MPPPEPPEADEPAWPLSVPAVVVEVPALGCTPLPPLPDPLMGALPPIGCMTITVSLSPPELHAKPTEKIPDRRRTEENGRDLSMAEPLEQNLETEFWTLSIFGI